jgi:hypothetical protein
VDSQLENVRKLLELKVGDNGRLEELQQRLENHKILFISDRDYLETLVQQHLSGRIPPKIEPAKVKESIISKPEPESIKIEEKVKSEELVIDKPKEPKIELPPEEKSGNVVDTPLQNEGKPKKPKFSLKRKKKESKSSSVNTELHWFWNKVEFRRQSKLAIAIGIITILFSFSVFATLPPSGSYSGWNSSSMQMGAIVGAIITWIVMILTGTVLISLGARQVPKYPSLANAIQDYVNEKVKESAKK